MVRFDGKRVAVVGLGAVANPPLVEFLVERGAEVTACDRKSAAELGAVYERLSVLPIRFNLGSDYLAGLDGYDTVYLTPAVRRDLPEVVAAKAKGVEVSSEILLFMHVCPARKVAITGSSGKTTTTTLTGEVFKAAGVETYVAGNIGVSLIKEAEGMSPDSWVVLELSSFQLQDFDIGPNIAAITNLTPNHLDYHPTMDDYADAKRRIYTTQRPGDTTILNFDDPITREMAASAPGRVLFFSRRQILDEGAFVENGKVIVKLDGRRVEVCGASDIRLPGLHNLENVLTASAIAMAAGIPMDAVRETVKTFCGVPNRLEYVGRIDGVDYYNDSIATTPDRTMAGVLSFEPRPIVMIAGGYDKKLPFDNMARVMPGRVRSVMLIGVTAPLIRQAIEKANEGSEAPVEMVDCPDFESAVRGAREKAHPGDVVLMSPACASYDMFANFEERGRRFKEIVASF